MNEMINNVTDLASIRAKARATIQNRYQREYLLIREKSRKLIKDFNSHDEMKLRSIVCLIFQFLSISDQTQELQNNP